MAESHNNLGKLGEAIARDFLEKGNYRIVTYNFIAPVGHSRKGRMVTGEIDIIAYDLCNYPPVLAFIEVKTRSNDELAAPEAAVDSRKRRRIIRAARVYRRIMGVSDEPFRYDVVSILASPDQSFKINILKNYFNEREYRRRPLS